MDNNKSSSSIIKLNIGGKLYTTTKGTLLKYDQDSTSFFSLLLSDKFHSITDENGYFIDRDGNLFEPILNYLRNGIFNPSPLLNIDDVIQESIFYGVNIDLTSNINDSITNFMISQKEIKYMKKILNEFNITIESLKNNIISIFLESINSQKELKCYIYNSKNELNDIIQSRLQNYKLHNKEILDNFLEDKYNSLFDIKYYQIFMDREFRSFFVNFLKRYHNLTININTKSLYIESNLLSYSLHTESSSGYSSLFEYVVIEYGVPEKIDPILNELRKISNYIDDFRWKSDLLSKLLNKKSYNKS